MPEKTEYEKNIDKILERMDEKHNLLTAPRSDEILKILSMIYTEEEAAIGATMSTIPEPPEAIATRLNMKKQDLIPILEKMCDKGAVYRTGEKGNYNYSIFAAGFGMIEATLVKARDEEETREFGRLWHGYYENLWGKTMHSTKGRFGRIIAIEREIPGQQQVLPYERVSRIIENAAYLSVTDCSCRLSKKLAGKGCSLNAPADVCLLLDDLGKHFVERGLARAITKDEAHEVIKKAEDAGLVHLTTDTKKDFLSICNCCPCCCMALTGFTQFGGTDAVGKSNYFPFIDRGICNGCKGLTNPICVDKCPMDAISLKSGKVVTDMARCIGCGICVHFCPVEGALCLKKKKKFTEPKEDLTDLITYVVKERTVL